MSEETLERLEEIARRIYDADAIKAREALQSEAGRELLGRLEKLEKVAEAARELVNKPAYRPELRDGWHTAWSKLRKALAALEAKRS